MTEEVTVADGKAEFAAHVVDVRFAIAGGSIFLWILGILDHVVYFVKHGPSHIERSSRLLVANHLAEVVKINQHYEDLRIDRQLSQKFSQDDATKNNVLSRTSVFEQDHSVACYRAGEKTSRAHRSSRRVRI